MANKRIKDLATTKYKGFMALDDAEGTGKFPIDNLIESIAPVFDSTVNYTAGQSVMYQGKLYTFKVDHSGAWNAADADTGNVSNLCVTKRESLNSIFAAIDNTGKFIEGDTFFNLVDKVQFVNGSVNSGGDLIESSIRIRSEFIPTSMLRCIYFSAAAGYKYEIEQYNHDGSFAGAMNFRTTDLYYYKALKYPKIILLIGKTDNSSISPADAVNITANAVSYIDEIARNNESSIVRISKENGEKKVILDYNNFKVGNLALNGSTPEINNLFPSRVSSVKPYLLKMNSIISLSDYTNYSFYVYYSADGTTYTDKGRKHADYYCEADGYYLVCINAEPTEVYQNNVAGYVDLLSIIPADTKEETRTKDTLSIVKNIHDGSFNPVGLENENNPTIRKRTSLAFAPKGSVLCVPKDLAKFYFQIGVYGDTVTFTDWKSEHYFESDTYFKLVIRKVDNTAFSSADEAEFKQLVRFVASPKNKYDELRKHNVRSVCHAGINGAPPNTIPSFLEAYLAGYDVMECDARRTKDGVWVLCHNATINATARNPDGTEIDGDVAVADTNYEDLLNYDFGIAYGDKYAGTKIPTCADAYKLFRDLDVEINVDIASYPAFSKSEIHELMDVVNAAGMHDRVFYLVTSGYASFIIEKDDTANLAYTSNAAWWELASTCLTGKNAVILNSDYTTLTTAKLDAMKEHGMPCEVWTIPNEAAMGDVSDPYITGVTSATVVAGKYYKKSTNVDTQNFEIPTAFLSRASSINGGFNRLGNEIFVDLNFVANNSATNSPSVLSDFPTPSDNMIVECVGYDAGTDTINDVSAMINTSGRLQLNQTISGCKYYVKGKYKM